MNNQTPTPISHIFVRDADDRGMPSWALVRNAAGGIRIDAQIGQRTFDFEVRLHREGKATLWRKADTLQAARALAAELIEAEQGIEVSTNASPLAGPHHFNVVDCEEARAIPSIFGGAGIPCIFPASIR